MKVMEFKCISFNEEKGIFSIETANTLYVTQIINGKHPVHLYYGKKDGAQYPEYEANIMSFSPFSPTGGSWPNYIADTAMLEYSGYDSGDYRASSLKINNKNGDSVTWLEYKDYEILAGRREIPGIPYADADDNTETLVLICEDELTKCTVKLYYTVFPREDVISRYVTVENNGDAAVTIEKLMSLTLDLPNCNYDMISFYGNHYYERKMQRVPLHYGAQNVFSRRGASSHQFNPFIAICDKSTDEEQGGVYGFNFVWSGSFLDEVEVDQTGSTRVQIGLGEENFSWHLDAGETFASPEAVMTYTDGGLGQMARNFHKFVNGHILPPEPFDCRPVVINTWEACYFWINEAEMLRFADAAKESDIDMLVMDDGWFGERNGDHAALGDWFPNKKKFPNGLKAFVDKVKERGIKFGIWIEPEMVNEDSDLYRAHPEWCIRCKDRVPMESRWQLVLDMGNPDVRQYLKDSLTKAFDGIDIDYFKWDMNRHISQVGSTILSPERQKEANFRYMLGVYEFYQWFVDHFKGAMLENCSGGGGRYDLGMMKYSTMIWTSDNTVPQQRVQIQYSSMLGYPASTMSCHVSNHKNICEVPRELKYRAEVAMGGALGYEIHLPNVSDTVRKTIKEQIATYRKYEDLILRGEYYPVKSPFDESYSAYYYMDESADKILVSYLQWKADEEREITVKVAKAKDGRYRDEEGRVYEGKELREGLKVLSDDTECNSKMWYLEFIKE